jgi:hypothetical protein
MSDANASADHAKKVVEDFLRTFSSGDVKGIVDALDDDATWWVAGSIENFSGTYTKQQMAELLPNFAGIYKSGALAITPESMVAEGDRVAVEATGYAELTNGRVYNPSYHFLFTIAGDKVHSIKEYMDTQHAHSIFFT